VLIAIAYHIYLQILTTLMKARLCNNWGIPRHYKTKFVFIYK